MRGSFMGAGGIPAPVNSEMGAFGAAVAAVLPGSVQQPGPESAIAQRRPVRPRASEEPPTRVLKVPDPNACSATNLHGSLSQRSMRVCDVLTK